MREFMKSGHFPLLAREAKLPIEDLHTKPLSREYLPTEHNTAGGKSQNQQQC